jgi:hypothetical protein
LGGNGGNALIQNSRFVFCNTGRQGGAIDGERNYFIKVKDCLFDRGNAEGL